MRIRIRLIIFFFCLICIISCASAAKEKRLYTNITDNSRFYLLPAEDIEKSLDMVQYVSASFGGNTYFFTAWVKADENAVEMVLFNEMGASIGELSYKTDAIHFSSTVIPRAALRYVKPEYIAADFQLCFYDPVPLSKALENCGLVLEVYGDNRAGSRRILDGDEVIIEIAKTGNSVALKNNLRGYSYTMEGEY